MRYATIVWMSLLVGGIAQMPRDEAVRLAKSTLAVELDVPEEELYARRVEEVEWPDASLGCPQEGESYAAGTVSGYRIWFRSGRRLYRVHVGDGRAVVCSDDERRPGREKPLPERIEEPVTPGPVTGEVPDAILDAIRADLLERVDASAGDIEVRRAESRIWSDGSLGCPEPGRVYTQALVEGYWVVLEHGGKSYDYRATTGGSFKLCEQLLPKVR